MKAIEEGEYVSPGMTILTIQDIERFWVRVDIDETKIGNIKINDPAVIEVLSLPSLRFSGRVFEIGSEGTFATERNVKGGRQDIKTFRVKVLIENPEGLLKTGMTGEVTFHGQGNKGREYY
jgi:multidrug efflux pump subunit AcrA (membrane-fusion protein)